MGQKILKILLILLAYGFFFWFLPFTNKAGVDPLTLVLGVHCAFLAVLIMVILIAILSEKIK